MDLVDFSKFSNLDKIFWPDEKYTKKDLLKYYTDISPIILPHLLKRPLVLHRFPDGIFGKSFYQKDAKEIKDISQTDVKHTGKTIKYLYINNHEDLIQVVNLGCIEFHPFLSRIGSIEYPDFLVFDLDPNLASFERVIEAALEYRKIFEALEIPSFCKVSGQSGLHIYLPLGAKYTYKQARTFAELISVLVHRKTKEISTLVRNPSKRGKKVYLDYLQNRSRQTMVSVYSLRPKQRAPVSAPVTWSEVNKKLRPDQWTMKTIFKRIDRYGDLFANLCVESIDLERILSNLENY